MCVGTYKYVYICFCVCLHVSVSVNACVYESKRERKR